jgi:alpha-tubulin suppressor-like RCC1 family protein
VDVFLPLVLQGTPHRTVTAQISAGGAHKCLLEADGSVMCWGYNYDGTSNPPAESFIQISAGEGALTCGIQSDGSMKCWAWNDYGEATPPAASFTQINIGYLHSCGLNVDGSIECWGLNPTWKTAGERP